MSRGDPGLGEQRLEMRYSPGPFIWVVGQCVAVMAVAAGVAWAGAYMGQQVPLAMPVPPGTIPIVVYLFSAGMFAFGAYGLWQEAKLRGLRVRVHERGLVLERGASRETCRWEMLAEVVHGVDPTHGTFYRLEMNDRPPLVFSGLYFGERAVIRLGEELWRGTNALPDPPRWRDLDRQRQARLGQEDGKRGPDPGSR